MDQWYRITEKYKRQFRAAKYLVRIEIDPIVDNVEDENMESRLTG